MPFLIEHIQCPVCFFHGGIQEALRFGRQCDEGKLLLLAPGPNVIFRVTAQANIAMHIIRKPPIRTLGFDRTDLACAVEGQDRAIIRLD